METLDEHTLLKGVVVEQRVEHHLLPIVLGCLIGTRNAHISNVPLSCAPHDSVPRLVLVHVHVLLEVGDCSNSQKLDVFFVLEIVLDSNFLHDVLDVSIVGSIFSSLFEIKLFFLR